MTCTSHLDTCPERQGTLIIVNTCKNSGWVGLECVRAQLGYSREEHDMMQFYSLVVWWMLGWQWLDGVNSSCSPEWKFHRGRSVLCQHWGKRGCSPGQDTANSWREESNSLVWLTLHPSRGYFCSHPGGMWKIKSKRKINWMELKKQELGFEKQCLYTATLELYVLSPQLCENWLARSSWR